MPFLKHSGQRQYQSSNHESIFEMSFVAIAIILRLEEECNYFVEANDLPLMDFGWCSISASNSSKCLSFPLDTFSFQDVIKYTLVGDEVAREFFYINPTTGEVSIKKPLTEGNTATYTVSSQLFH